jgi:hypothetical protein
MPTISSDEKSRRNLLAQKKYHANNAKTVNERSRNRRLANPDNQRQIRRRAHLKSSYGITPAEYDFIFQAQKNVCGICETPNPGSKKGWHIDHCHSTGKVRGILCTNCNLMIGHAKDDLNRMVAAMFYLLKYQGV